MASCYNCYCVSALRTTNSSVIAVDTDIILTMDGVYAINCGGVACFFSIGVSTCDRNVHQASRVVSRDPPRGELVGFEPVPKLTRGRFCHEG
ncbi:unnamed protein product [Ectocarpus sp. 8 AP-2014]